MTTSSYENSAGSGSKGVLWSGIGLAGRQGLLIVLSVILARILGPDAFGIVAQAAVYMSLTALILDQGISAALISSQVVTRRTAGAATTVNLGLALILGCITLFVAQPVAEFFRTPELAMVLWVLGGCLWLKALAVIPRVLLARSMNFRFQAVADLSGAIVGGGLAVVGALLGWDYWALVLQGIASDLIVSVVLIIVARPPAPNFAFRALKRTWAFGYRILAGNFVSYSVQNVDTLLIGRFFSTQSVAYYSFAYRVLTTPIQMISQVVTRVLFPAISRARVRDASSIPALIYRCVQSISLASFPLMALVGVSATETVPLLVGEAWLPVIPLLMIFALGGARQSVTTVNTAVMMGMGRADITLRFSLVAATVQISCIVIGLQWGPVGVAIAFTAAGFLLTPVICVLQKRVAGMSYKRQLAAVLPAAHCSLWATAAYLLVSSLAMGSILTLVAGSTLFIAVYLCVLRLAHYQTWRDAVVNVRGIVSR